MTGSRRPYGLKKFAHRNFKGPAKNHVQRAGNLGVARTIIMIKQNIFFYKYKQLFYKKKHIHINIIIKVTRAFYK